MALTIKQLAKGKITTATTTDVYTAPANTRAILRLMTFQGPTADTDTVSMWDGTTAFRLEDDVATDNAENYDHQLVLEATQSLRVITSGTGPLYYVISGAEIAYS